MTTADQLDSGPTRAATNTRWLIFGLACFTSFLTYVHRYAWGVTRPYLMEETNLTPQQMGWLDSVFNLTYAFGQFPGGLLGDIFGPRTMIPLATLLWTVAVTAPAWTGGFWRLMVARLTFGATQAPAYPNLGKITQSWFPLSIRTTLQGFVASFSGRAGAALAPILIGTLLMGICGLSWQASLYVLAAVGVVYAVVFWWLFRNDPARHHWVNDAELRVIREGERGSSKSGKPKLNLTAANLFNLGIFMAASFCSTFADNLFVFYMPTFLVQEKGFSSIEMGIFASLPLFGGAFGGMCGGALNDVLIRVTGNRRLARSLVASTGKTVAAVLIAASLLVDDGRLIMLVLFCCKFFSDWSQPTWWGTVTDIGGRAAGSVFGMVNMVGSIGAFAAGPAMGAVLGDHGWTALFLFVGAVYILTALFWVCVNCTRRLVAE